MKATARWPRVARENAITALRCAVASWFALWWLNAGIGGRHNVPDNLPVGFLAVSIIVLSRDANSLGAWLLLGAVMGISLGIDAESLGLLVDALADTTHSLGALARCLAGVARDDSLQPMFARAAREFADRAAAAEKAIHFNSDDRLSAALAAFEDFRVELSTNLSDAWDAYYDGTVQKSCSDEAALARMGALAAIEHACVHLAGAASLADSADFESKGCVRSILDV